jgi:hypothetical protein
MERQTDGQRYGEQRNIDVHAPQVKGINYIGDKEVVILKHCQHTYIGHQTHNKESLSSLPFGIFYKDTRYVVNNDGCEQYYNVDRDEVHVKDATCDQQMKPTELMRQQKEQNRNYREE